jgi:transposase
LCDHLFVATRGGKVHVAVTRRHYKDKVYETTLLRRSYREDGKVKTETVGNLSHLPGHVIELIRRGLAGEQFLPASGIQIERTLPHGNVVAVLGLLRRLGLEQILDRAPSRCRDLCVGMIVQRLLRPSSKLATTQLWGNSTLSSVLGVEDADEDELYAALDWLIDRQEHIEDRLARRHLEDGALVLYDLTSSYVEGRHCPLAKLGYSRDGKKGTLQIEYGLVTDAEGCPVAVEVVPGNTGDPATVASQVAKLKGRFGLRDVVLVGDRGMLTSARIEALKETGGIEWISALRSPQIRALVEGGTLQLSLFDERNLAEITDPAYPGERLVVCKNPLLAAERTRKREELLAATEAKLASIAERVAGGQLRGAAAIGLRVGRVLNTHKVGKHFDLQITDTELVVGRKQAEITAETALDGIYVLRTSVVEERLDSAAVVRAYKRLSTVERAFRSLKAVDLQIRPIYHWAERRVRAHVLLCMLAYYVQWHLERAWAPLLYRDEERPIPEDPVAPAQRSVAAQRKASTQRLDDGTPVHSLRTLLADLATLARNRMTPSGVEAAAFEVVTTPTPLQARALRLLNLTAASLS